MPTKQALENALNVRLPEATYVTLTQLTKVHGRTTRFLAITAIETYLEWQAWQIDEVKAGPAQADYGEFATEAEMQRIRVGSTRCTRASLCQAVAGRGRPPHTNMRPISC